MGGNAIPVNVGDRFGNLTVINPDCGRDSQSSVLVELQCDCGDIRIVRRSRLFVDPIEMCKSCYLKHRSESQKIHGMRYTETYLRWTQMKQRCDDPNHTSAQYYQNVGYDPAWSSFENFFKDMGECPPGYSLDRIDNTKGYYKENCRWVPKIEQNRNKSNLKLTLEKANEIRQKYATGNFTILEMATQYNCSTTLICNVLNNKYWV